MKTYVTGRIDFIDIDTLACSVGYRDLLRAKGEQAEALLPQRMNPSVTKTTLSWARNIVDSTDSKEEHIKYVLVDCSEPPEVEKFIKPEQIIAIFDHYGDEEAWKKYPHIQLNIVEVGACSTLIAEEWVKSGLIDQISTEVANLLYLAIVVHTLNFHSSVTTDRDKNAVEILKRYASITDADIESYFKEVDAQRRDMKTTLKDDIKLQEIYGKSCAISQLELWDSKTAIDTHYDLILNVLDGYNTDYAFLNAPSISEGINYLVTMNPEIRKYLEEKIDATFDGNVGKTKKLWLRKEILKLLK